jgi:hypothetical protein
MSRPGAGVKGRRIALPAAVEIRRCAHCRVGLGRRVSTARFCSDACRARGYRRRRQDVDESFPVLVPWGSASMWERAPYLDNGGRIGMRAGEVAP